MSYQSVQFLFFVGVALLVYYWPGRKHQRYVLAGANAVFYISAGIQYLPFIVAVMAATFWTGKKISAVYDAADIRLAECTDQILKKHLRLAAKKKAKRILGAGMLVTIGLLVICKYSGFVCENLNLLLSKLHLSTVNPFEMILPIGISFYSFMALSYILDIYWKRHKAEKCFLNYAVYLSYFPHVVQGPIDRYYEFRWQIENRVHFNYKNVTFGAQLMLWGFFKKLVIADRMGWFVDAVFDKWQVHNGFVLITAVITYSLQIYADFSGCIDIVTGVSEMFGIKLRKNFNHPYFSKTMAEFWRRWHISLQEWFKDYVYFPFSTSSFMRTVKKYLKGKSWGRAYELASACFPILVVWSVTGIWHGASWKYVVWGLFHASLLIASKISEPFALYVRSKMKSAYGNPMWKLVQVARTFTLCCIGRVFFRANDLTAAISILKKMIDPRVTLTALRQPPTSYGIDIQNVCVAMIASAVILIVDLIQEKYSIREALAKRNIVLRWILIYLCIFAILILGVYGPGHNTGNFIYEQF